MSEPAITSFTGEHRWLSNFWSVPILMGEGVFAATAEHAYQALKATDIRGMLYVLSADTPASAKRRGREIQIRSDWDKVKDQIMALVLDHKFRDPVLRQKLIDTGSAELIEGNTWGDTYWGVCKGQGENRLGKLLMALRARLQEEILEQKEAALRLEADMEQGDAA